MKSPTFAAIGTALCVGLLSCEKSSIQPSPVVDTKLDPSGAALAQLTEMGGRLSREGDVPFVFAPFDEDQIELLMGHMKEAGILLALPDSIDLGNGLWKIAPEDLENGRAVVERHHLKESLKGFHFE